MRDTRNAQKGKANATRPTGSDREDGDVTSKRAQSSNLGFFSESHVKTFCSWWPKLMLGLAGLLILLAFTVHIGLLFFVCIPVFGEGVFLLVTKEMGVIRRLPILIATACCGLASFLVGSATIISITTNIQKNNSGRIDDKSQASVPVKNETPQMPIKPSVDASNSSGGKVDREMPVSKPPVQLPSATPVRQVESNSVKKYALVVGVKEYDPDQPLPLLAHTHRDAQELADVLKKAGFDVTLMVDTNDQPRPLQPSFNHIRRELDNLVSRPALKDDDIVLVAFAGHGVKFDEKVGNGTASKFYFCPMDADLGANADQKGQLLSLDSLYSQLDRCKAGTRLLLVDACRNDPSHASNVRSANSVTLPKLPPPPGGTVAFFSCSENQRAYEDADLKHGIFFYNVIRGLQGEADLTRDGNVTAAELGEFVGGQVYDYVLKKYRTQQTPEMHGTIRGNVPLIQTTGHRPTF